MMQLWTIIGENKMSDYHGYADEDNPIHTVNTLIVQLNELRVKGYGEYDITVRGEYALDKRYTVDKAWCEDKPTIDFYGQA